MIKRLVISVLIVFSIILSACSNLNNSEHTETAQVSIQDNTSTADIEETSSEQITTNEKTMKLYQKFLEGNITVKGVDINYISTPTGEPDKRNTTVYSFFDSNGDEVPELHVRSGRYYYILTVKNNELSIWKDLSDPYYFALNDGTFLRYDPISAFDKINYDFIIFNFSGNEMWKLNFYQTGEGEYYFAGVEVTKEQWEALTKQFFYIDNKGVFQVRNEIQWIVLYE